MHNNKNEELIKSAQTWFSSLESAIAADDSGPMRALFADDSYWRDVLGTSWEIETYCGIDAITDRLGPALRAAGAENFRLDPARPAPRLVSRVGTEIIEAFFTFETKTGACEGILRLDANGTAWTLSTALDQIRGFEEALGAHRPTGQSHSRDFRGPNWLDQRADALDYENRSPAVLVVGAGQAGLTIAARLAHLGVDTLIVDKHARIGDNWRHRYHALTLHNQVQVNHLPYMPFPPGWPTYIAKDKLANWLESYADAMELNVWTGTEFQGGDYDEVEKCWSVKLNRPSHGARVLKPRHVIMATGVSGIPNRPDIPSLKNFTGEVLHSSEYRDGEDWTGKKAIVIGSGNSAHDISQDLQSSGADVVMIQRSPTLVVNIEPSAQIAYALYSEEPSVDICDQIVTSMPLPLTRKAHMGYTAQARAIDKPLLDGLEKAGFRLDFGEDGTGWQFLYLTRGGGYYFNVGCSELIADGKVKLMPYDDVQDFTETGMALKSGENVEADLIVLATGYREQEYLVQKLFGSEIADRVGPIWGFGDGMELRNMYCRTGQAGLWFIAGSLAQCRINSKYLALQIKAAEEGLLPARR